MVSSESIVYYKVYTMSFNENIVAVATLCSKCYIMGLTTTITCYQKPKHNPQKPYCSYHKYNVFHRNHNLFTNMGFIETIIC